MKRHTSFLLTLLVAAIGFSGIAWPSSARASIEVVATVGDLGAAAREVGGDRVSVTTLARPKEDPHYVDAKPNYVKTLSDADLLILNGLSLEVGWLPELLESARNGDIQKGQTGYFDASSVVDPLGVPDTSVTRSMGDVHPDGNPHFTLDPRQMARISIGLGKRLADIDPDHADAYHRRARSFAKSCLKTAERWKQTFNSLDDSTKKVVVYHEAWPYVTDWLGLNQVATVEPKPGVEPGPKHIGQVVSTINNDSVRALLKMEYYPSSVASTITDKTDASLVTSQGHTRADQSYIDRIDNLARSLHDALSNE